MTLDAAFEQAGDRLVTEKVHHVVKGSGGRGQRRQLIRFINHRMYAIQIAAFVASHQVVEMKDQNQPKFRIWKFGTVLSGYQYSGRTFVQPPKTNMTRLFRASIYVYLQAVLQVTST